MATPFIKESISPQRAKALQGDLAAKANNEIKTNKAASRVSFRFSLIAL
jgi:hypothetical protein